MDNPDLANTDARTEMDPYGHVGLRPAHTVGAVPC
jgi:hypothetical protein